MKLLKTLILPAALLCGVLTPAARAEIPDYEPVKINQTDNPVFPRSLIALGLRRGVASIAVAIDDKGLMSDYLVTAYSHPDFASQAVASLKKWTFEPARIHGSPRNSKVDLTFNFEVEGVVVVSLTPMSYAELIRFELLPNSMAYSACTLGQLDRIPTPKKVVSPVYPKVVARSSQGGHVSVEFYIDELGHVRMPSVNRETDVANEEISAIAVSTVEQWQFEPPTCKGRPVLVRAQQDFDFKPLPR